MTWLPSEGVGVARGGCYRGRGVAVLLSGALLPLLAPAAPARADAVVVTTELDEYGTNANDCSLREAIKATNGNSSFGGCAYSSSGPMTLPDAISVPPGTYSLTISGTDDTNAAGDLDITQQLFLQGAGKDDVKIQVDRSAVTDRVFHVAGSVVAVISGVTITKGKLAGANSEGAGLYGATGSSVSVVDSLITDNEAGDLGGGIAVDEGTLSLTSTGVSDNRAQRGGGVASNGGTLTMMSSTVSRNVAWNGEGGGIYHTNGPATIGDSTIEGNDAVGGGGGMYTHTCCDNASSTTVTHSAFLNNSSNGETPADADGGFGAAVYSDSDGTVELTNVTVSGNNSSDRASDGAGAVDVSAGTLALAGTTVSNNTHAMKVFGNATANVKSSILANSGGAFDCSGAVTFQAVNIIETPGSGCTPQKADLTVDPKLQPLAAGGGGTRTHALAKESPAIDAAADNACESQDQRHYVRPIDGPDPGADADCDVGAYEAVPLAIADATVDEGDAGTTPAMFTLTITSTVPDDVSVWVRLVNGTTSTADVDSCSPEDDCIGEVTIPEGDTAAGFTVRVRGDTTREPDETFSVLLEEPSSGNFIFDDAQGEGLVNDDDAPPPPVVHPRAAGLNLRTHLRAAGRLTVRDGFGQCRRERPLKLQRRSGGRWLAAKTFKTGVLGYYATRLPDRPGRYRTLAVRSKMIVAGRRHVCARATSPVRRHRH